MKHRFWYTVFTVACWTGCCCTGLRLHAQTGAQAAPTPTAGTQAAAPQGSKRQPPKPAADQAPGAAPDKVWVNSSSKVYHCPGDRYYGRTKKGSYMTEAQAKALGDHGPRGETCFK
jgi:hypothetical protein